MKKAPRAGPTARNANAQRHPTRLAIQGRSWMETTVTAKPSPFWTVRAVPVYSGGQWRAARAENWGESETTKKPQASRKTRSPTGGRAEAKPDRGHTVPLARRGAR